MLPNRWAPPLLALASIAVFLLNWVLRYNEPEGAFGGLTDDHMFYVVQGWQLLFGELPDRDVVDTGSPLTFAISAGLQLLLGRSVWSEYVFCVLALSAGAALTCVLAARITGSVLLGIVAAMIEIVLRPRLYNYPKIIVYVVAIAALWWWIASPSTRRTWLMAAVTAFALLMRHDHGIYVGAAFVVALVVAPGLTWTTRVRRGLVYGLATVLFLAPYLIYLQQNGGALEHFMAGARYSARDYERTPLELPVPSFPALHIDAGADAETSWWEREPFVTLAEQYHTWWMYWLLMLVPIAALGLLAATRSTGPPLEHPKIIVLAVLAVILNVRLIRGNLDGRFADVAVPIAILSVWCLGTVTRIVRKPAPAAVVLPRAALAVATLAIVFVTGAILTRSTGELVRGSSILDGLDAVSRDASLVTRQMEQTWPLDYWTDDTTGQIGLSKYLYACTKPDDRVLMTPFLPPVLALAQRGYAAGRLDFRGGFYDTPADQRLAVARLQRQSVPIAIGPPGSGATSFMKEFPIVAEYVYREYRSAGDRDLGGGLTLAVLVRRDAQPSGRYEPLSLPCFR